MYSRTWFTTLAGVPLLCGVYFSALGGTRAWIVLAVLLVVVVALIWAVPQSIVGERGVRVLLGRRSVAWSDVAAVLDPRPGDEDVRVELTDGRVLALPGVPPAAVPQMRALRSRHHRRSDGVG